MRAPVARDRLEPHHPARMPGRARAGLLLLSGALLALLFLLAACDSHTPVGEPMESTLWSAKPAVKPALREVPLVFGDQPADDANAIVGSWKASGFHITSGGHISARLEFELDKPPEVPLDQSTDVLFLQVWANYIWPDFGDLMSKPAGEFIPVLATRSTETSATFKVDERFDVPPLEVDDGGGMPLYTLHVMAVWYRAYRVGNGLAYYHAKVGYPGDPSEGWKGQLLIDRSSTSLRGTLDTRVPGGLPFDAWLQANLGSSTGVPLFTSPVPHDK